MLQWLAGLLAFVSVTITPAFVFGVDLSAPFDAPVSTTTLRARTKAFAKEAAGRLSLPAEKMEKIEALGFGRAEMIAFAMIVEKSTKSWEDQVKARQKGVTLRSMAEEAGMNYKDVFFASRAMKEEIEAGLKTTP